MITYAVRVFVEQAIAIAVVARVGMRARSVIVCGRSIIIAGAAVRATANFELIAYAVAVAVVVAVAIAIIARVGVIAIAGIRRIGVVVASRAVLAA